MNFTAQNKLQQALYFFLINQTTSQEEKNQLTETFKRLDKNQDGVLSKEELIEGMKKSKIFLTQEEVE